MNPSAKADPVLRGPREILTFNLGAEEYGVDILKVQEIRGYDAVTPIANTPACMKGVINLRGVIVPIIDMRVKFGLEHVVYDHFTVVIILNVDRRVMGVVVDGVSDVVPLTPDMVRPAPDIGVSVDLRYLAGIATVENRMIILTDIEALVTASELMPLETEPV